MYAKNNKDMVWTMKANFIASKTNNGREKAFNSHNLGYIFAHLEGGDKARLGQFTLALP